MPPDRRFLIEPAGLLREVAGIAARRLMELEAGAAAGAAHGGRSADRPVQRSTSVAWEACVQGVPTRSVDALVQAMSRKRLCRLPLGRRLS